MRARRMGARSPRVCLDMTHARVGPAPSPRRAAVVGATGGGDVERCRDRTPTSHPTGCLRGRSPRYAGAILEQPSPGGPADPGIRAEALATQTNVPCGIRVRQSPRVPLPQRPRRQPQRWRDAATHADQAPTSSGQVHVHDRFVQRVDAVPAVDVPSPLQRLERRPYPRVDHPRASQPIFQRGGAEGTRGIVQLAPPGRRAARRAEGPSRPRFRLLVGRVDRPQVGPLPLVQGRPRVHRAHPRHRDQAVARRLALSSRVVG